MKLLPHTDDHQPTLMRDICDSLVGTPVTVYTKGFSFSGIMEWNGGIIKLTVTSRAGEDYRTTAETIYYIPTHAVDCICGN